MLKQDLKSQTREELTAYITSLGQPAFRAKQIFRWLHRGVEQFSEITDLPKTFQQVLEEQSTITTLRIYKSFSSSLDETTKYLFLLRDNHLIETVVMKYHHGYSICISSQVGCRMGCSFCQSTKNGLVRSLTAGEILDQILKAQQDLGIRISNIVMMGIGEPLDNLEQVTKFLNIVNDPEGINIGYRHISLSTCGLVPGIESLAKLDLPITLSISLHATTDEDRSNMMPVNRKYKLKELLEACRQYQRVTGRRISFEYAVINGVNDRKEDAERLSHLLKGLLCHINLIPVNPIEAGTYSPPSKKNIMVFQNQLINLGLNATIRRTLGSDISASCGQLRHKNLEKEEMQ
ncbi:MAG: 23S rRNA (adenine(2503)-C(2))-methyltransferase RlmN [Clostridia bacterium]|nr:23S rRNA (adenine(2503)-C(2))-methyltransferase RlmN [Clostridia bacterium]